MEWSTIVALTGLCYGTVGLVMWVITQVRLTRVERRVTKKIDDGAVAIEGRMNKAMDRLDSKVDEISTELPDAADISIPDEQVDALASKIYGMFQGERGNAMKQMQAELLKFGAPMDEIAESLMDGARSARLPGDIALQKLLTVELSPQFRKKFPQYDFLIKSGQVTIAQLYDLARQTGALTGEHGAAEAVGVSGKSGFGVR